MMDYGKNQALNPQGGWNLYSNSFFFCSTCVQNVPPAVAIKSFFCVENVLDALLFLSWAYNTFAGSSSSNPPAPKLNQTSGAGFVGTLMVAIVYIFYFQIVCLIAGFVLSFLARSELSVVGAKGSWPVQKTKLALLLYMIYIIINVTLFAIIFGVLIVTTVFAGSAGGSQAAGAVGFFAILIALLMLPFALLWTSQLMQVCKMREAANEIEGTGALNSTM
jgi:hypothetical protein